MWSIGECMFPPTALSPLLQNFPSNKYHPLYWKYRDIEGKKVKQVTKQNQVFQAVNDIESAYRVIDGLLSLEEESESTRKLTLYMHGGAKGGIDNLLWERVFCHVLKGLGHPRQRQGQDSGKNNPAYEGRSLFCWTVFLYVGETFLCLKEDNLAGFCPEELPSFVHLQNCGLQ